MTEDEESRRSLWLLLPEPVRQLPADLAAVALLVLAACLVVTVPVVNETPLRVVFGLPFLLFLPGYALVAALFPETGRSQAGPTPEGDSETADSDAEQGSAAEDDGSPFESGAVGTGGSGIDPVERVALSFGLSVAIVPLVGLVLNFTPWGIRLGPILVGVSAVTLGLLVVAAERRRQLPPDEQFAVPYRQWIARVRAELFEPESQLDGVLNVLLVGSMLLAVGAVGYAVMVPPQGESFSEFYLLGEDDDGELVAANYPTEFTLGESQPVVVGITNNENEATEYTVVVQLQTVAVAGNETTVTEREQLDQFRSPQLADNETWHHEYDIAPTRTGEQLRVQFLLYRGDPPESPTVENAYRDVHLWIDVRGSDT